MDEHYSGDLRIAMVDGVVRGVYSPVDFSRARRELLKIMSEPGIRPDLRRGYEKVLRGLYRGAIDGPAGDQIIKGLIEDLGI